MIIIRFVAHITSHIVLLYEVRILNVHESIQLDIFVSKGTYNALKKAPLFLNHLVLKMCVPRIICM